MLSEPTLKRSFASRSSQVVIEYVILRAVVIAPVNMIVSLKEAFNDHKNADNRAKSDYCSCVLKNSTAPHCSMLTRIFSDRYWMIP